MFALNNIRAVFHFYAAMLYAFTNYVYRYTVYKEI